MKMAACWQCTIEYATHMLCEFFLMALDMKEFMYYVNCWNKLPLSHPISPSQAETIINNWHVNHDRS